MRRIFAVLVALLALSGVAYADQIMPPDLPSIADMQKAMSEHENTLSAPIDIAADDEAIPPVEAVPDPQESDETASTPIGTSSIEPPPDSTPDPPEANEDLTAIRQSSENTALMLDILVYHVLPFVFALALVIGFIWWFDRTFLSLL